MVAGKDAKQIGVNNAMIDSFGDTIFHLSHNIQRRVGDPIRLRDFDEVERQRAQLGLADVEIASRLGLTADQVGYIRNLMEWRHFERSHYHVLNELGGGRRYRPERQVQPADLRAQHDRANQLRDALTYDPELVRRYVEEGWWTSDTLGDWLDRWADKTPDAPALRHGDRVIGYADFARQARHLAGAFYDLGLRKGDVVAVQLPNLPEYLLTFAALAYLGGVLTTIYMPHRRQEMRTLMGHSGARAFVGLGDAGGFAAAETALDLRGELPLLDHVVTVDPPVDGAIGFASLLDGEVPEMRGEPPVAGDPLVLLYTSGTTSSPKGVPHASRSLLGNARVGVAEHELTGDDVILSAAPFGHLFPLYSVQLAFRVGACNLLLPNFTPPELAACIAEGRPSALFAAPAHIAACLGMGLLDDVDLDSLKLSILSGAAVPAELAKAFAAKAPDMALTQLWGMTETQAGLYSRPGDGIDVAAASAGRASPGTDVRIMDDEGKALPAGEIGELQVRGPLLFPGYFDNPEANRDAFTEDGFFRSGDLARMDPAGNVAIVGRTKDVINRGGVKYNPRDVEDLLDGHPKIMQSAIVGLPDEVLGERACCFAVAAPDAELTLEEICDYLLGHDIAKTKLPERLELVDDMPMTPTRKIIKGKLAAQLKT